MFKVIFQLLILLYVILLIFNLLELKKYNINGIIVECDNYQEVLFNIKNLYFLRLISIPDQRCLKYILF